MKSNKKNKINQGYGLIQLIHGYGKGKTTAALGQAIRCAGSGRKVLIIYFDKGGDVHYSERALLDKIENIDYLATGRDRIDENGKFDFSIIEKDKMEALRALDIARDYLINEKYSLIILDEINSTCDLGMLNIEDIINILKKKSDQVEVILTGRNPHKKLLKIAHLISNVNNERHYFYSGVKAREGLDF